MSEVLQSPENYMTAQQVLAASRPLLEHFGVTSDPTTAPEVFMNALQQMDPRYQGGRILTRFQLAKDQRLWPEDSKYQIMQAAERLRMRELETPFVGDHDLVVILAGFGPATYNRARYAAQAARDGKATFRHLVCIGSTRQLEPSEAESVVCYARGARIEADIVDGAASAIQYTYSDLSVGTHILDDPTAGIPAILTSLLETLQISGTGLKDQRLAAVTTQLYQVSTALDVRRVAGLFGTTETFVGGSPSTQALIDRRTTATYFSEVLRTLRAASQALLAAR